MRLVRDHFRCAKASPVISVVASAVPDASKVTSGLRSRKDFRNARSRSYPSPLRRLPSFRRLSSSRGSLASLRRSELSDQLDRASISVPLNIAEGSGRSTPRERARAYTIARGSAVECLACLDLIELESSAPDVSEARVVLV